MAGILAGVLVLMHTQPAVAQTTAGDVGLLAEAQRIGSGVRATSRVVTVDRLLRPYRHIDGKAAAADLSWPLRILRASPRFAVAGGSAFSGQLFVAEPDGGSVAAIALLGLFDANGALRDLADVGNDHFVSLDPKRKIQLAPDADILVVTNRHHNSNQAYHEDMLVTVRGGRLAKLLAIAMLDVSGCGYRARQRAFYRVAQDAGGAAALHVEVRESVVATGENCGNKPPVAAGPWRARVTRATDGALRAQTSGLAALEKYNEGRM